MTGEGVNNIEVVDQTSSTLLDRVQQQDSGAWARLVHLYSPLVWLWCRQQGLQPEDAEDIGQEVFCAVARAIGTFRHDQPGSTFRGWLFIITRNKLRDRRDPPGGRGVGGEKGEKLLLTTAVYPQDPEDSAAPAEEKQILYRRALELLRTDFEPRSWQAFWRVVVEEEAPAQVAASLAMTLNALYLAKSRVLRRLREEFGGLLGS